jgi:flagellar hook-associated protein 3 FlgL
MRVTDSFRYRSVILDLNRSRERMTALQEQLATGKRINRPSDAPIDASISMRLRTVLESNLQFDRINDDATAFLSTTEGTLEDINSIILDIRDLNIQAANDATSPRDDLADQLDLMLQSLMEVANTRFQGKYIFAGTKTLSVPFTVNTSVQNGLDTGDIVDYHGNDDNFRRQLNENTAVDVNITGAQLFKDSASGGEDIFQHIWELRNHLLNDDTEAIRGKIEDFDNTYNQVLETYLEVGTKTQLAMFNKDRFEKQNNNLRNRISELEDTDFGAAFVNFKAEENALQSALSAGARVVSPSLIDFVGAG